MRTPHFRLTIRQIMGLVIIAAFWCDSWAYLQRWEARRAIMYQQRDITRSVMLEAQQDIIAAGQPAPEIRNERPRGTYTTRWTEWLDGSETGNGQKLSLIRATVSGDNGWFSLQPIIVETYGSPLDAPWLDRLLRAYRETGWRYKVVQAPASEYLRKRQEWMMKEKWPVRH
jgi:hypothetical protein